jgi:hypothetical protein
MAKLSFKQIDGEVTNYDSSDLKPSTATLVENLCIKNGFLEANLPKGMIMQQDPKTNKSINIDYDHLPRLGNNWEWETGTFCKLSSDLLSKEYEPFENNFLVLIAVKEDDGEYIRQVWAKKWTETTGEYWMRLVYIEADEENYGSIRITQDMLTTSTEGKTFFINENGILKIYMPHDCFWLGYINRDYQVSSNWTISNINDLYFDRLVEPINLGDMTVTTNDNSELVCVEGKRLGIDLDIEAIDETSDVVIESNNLIKFVYLREDKYNTGDSTNVVKIYSAIYQGGTRDGEAMKNTFIEPYPGYNSYEWCFYQEGGDAGSDSWLIPTEVTKMIKWNGSGWDPFTNNVNNPYISENGHRLNTPYINFYSLTELSITSLTYVDIIASGDIEETGISSSIKASNIVVTGVLDKTTELILYHNLVTYLGSASKYGLYGSLTLPVDINKRLTDIKFYFKNQDLDDYYLVKTIDLLSDDDQTYSKFLITNSEIESSGTTLSSQIAYAFDEDKKSEYKVLTGFRAFTTQQGVSLGLTPSDTSNIYYSILGGGNLQPDLVYKENILDMTFDKAITALRSLSTNLIAFTNSSMHIIRVDNVNESLIFSSIDTLELGVKNSYDVSQIQGGVVVNTPVGIFITDGYNKKWLSEEINSELEENYSNSSIMYNPYKQEVYWWVNDGELRIRKYSFEWQRWNHVYYGNGTLKEVIVDLNGNVNMLINGDINDW